MPIALAAHRLAEAARVFVTLAVIDAISSPVEGDAGNPGGGCEERCLSSKP
jgi:hypothetical protein